MPTFLIAVALIAGIVPPVSASAGFQPAGESQRQVLRGQLVAFAAGENVDLGTTPTRVRDGSREVGVTVTLLHRFTTPDLGRLRAAGFVVRNAGGLLVDGYASAVALRILSADATIESIRPIIRSPSDVLASQGASVLGASAWNTAGFTGAGVKLGIVDAGFEGLSALLGAQLPATVVVRCYTGLGAVSSDPTDCSNGERHGTAVAESVASIAPGVSLYLADPVTPLETSQSIAWMTANGVRIINASWSSGTMLEGPGDGTSKYRDSTYLAVDQAVAGGALWVNAAGNDAMAFWAGPWSDADNDGWLEFASASEHNDVVLGAGETLNIALRWTSTKSDYALSLWHDSAEVSLSDDSQSQSGDPFEFISYTAQSAGTYSISVASNSGPPDPRLRMMVHSSNDADLSIAVAAGSLPTPADSANPGEISVGATYVGAPDTIETYSSRGLTADGRVKPDLVSVDCVPTSAFAHFCGTSQAAPFVAGAAALALEANPSLKPATLAAWLRSHTTPLGGTVPNGTYGFGRLTMGPSPSAMPTAAQFVGPPASGVAGTPLLGQPAIAIIDANGHRITAGSFSVASVSLTIASGAGTLTCDGGNIRVAIGGIAAFTGCAIDTAGTFTIRADVTGLPSALSAPFDVLPAGSALPLTIQGPTSLAYPGSATLTIAFAAPIGTSRPVELQASPDGADWASISSTTTDANGVAQVSFVPRVSMRYRALFAGAGDAPVEVSGSQAVAVARRLLTSASVPTGRPVRRGGHVTLTLTSRPAGVEVVPGKARIDLYRRGGTAWRFIRSVFVVLNASGTGHTAINLAVRGQWWLRPRAEATATNAASAWSAGYRYPVL